VSVAVLSAAGSSTVLQPLAASAAPVGLAPEALEQALSLPPIFVHTGTNILEGSAVDPSGVDSVQVQILDPSGDTTDTTCVVNAPKSGVWSCFIDVPEAPDETLYFARARATNAFGYTSNWSGWRVLVVDTLPPTVSLDIASQSILSNTVLGPADTLLSGQIQDNAQVRSVDFCLSQPGEGESCYEVELSENNGQTGAWSAILHVPLGVDNDSQALFLYGYDAAGNRSDQPYEQTFRFDTVPPSVTITTQLSVISPADYFINPQPILAGTASDGSGQVEIVVRMTSAGGGAQRTVIPVNNNQWSYLPEISAAGVYSLSLQARDAAGNLTSLGSWTLQVGDFYRYWFPLICK
jgi:hypothetical protein